MDGRGSTSLYRYSIPTLLQSIALDSVLPFLTLYLVQTLSYSNERAASLLGLAITITTALRLVVGRVIDQFDKRITARIGLVMLFVLPVMLLLRADYGVIVGAVILSMVGDLLFSSSTVNLIYRELDEERAKLAVSHFYAAANAATFIAPTLALLFGTARLGQIFVFSAVATAVALLVHMVVFRSEKVRPTASDETPVAPVSGRPVLLCALGVGVGVSLVYGHWTSTVPLAIRDVRLWGFEIFPVMMLLSGALTLALQPVYRWVCARISLSHLPWMGAVLFSMAFATLATSPHHVVYVLLFIALLSAGECLLFPSITSIICEAAPANRRSTWLALYGMTRAVGGGSIAVGGMLLQRHPEWAYFSFLVAATVPLLLAAMGLRRTMNRGRSQPAPRPSLEPAA